MPDLSFISTRRRAVSIVEARDSTDYGRGVDRTMSSSSLTGTTAVASLKRHQPFRTSARTSRRIWRAARRGPAMLPRCVSVRLKDRTQPMSCIRPTRRCGAESYRSASAPLMRDRSPRADDVAVLSGLRRILLDVRRRTELVASVNALERVWRDRVASRMVRRLRFGAFGTGSIIEPPFRVVSADRIHIGRDVRIRPNAWFSVVANERGTAPMLSIGDGAILGADLVIACIGHVDIGPAVMASDRVFIGDTYHEYRDVQRPIRDQGLAPPRPVKICTGAFLGIGAIVLPGVTIGENAYVGAGAVVTRDVPARSVAVGNPARIVSQWDASAREWRPQSVAWSVSGG
jgi:acetyltransferase-like isoleucine patch superfamily enzyme